LSPDLKTDALGPGWARGTFSAAPPGRQLSVVLYTQILYPQLYPDVARFSRSGPETSVVAWQPASFTTRELGWQSSDLLEIPERTHFPHHQNFPTRGYSPPAWMTRQVAFTRSC